MPGESFRHGRWHFGRRKQISCGDALMAMRHRVGAENFRSRTLGDVAPEINCRDLAILREWSLIHYRCQSGWRINSLRHQIKHFITNGGIRDILCSHGAGTCPDPGTSAPHTDAGGSDRHPGHCRPFTHPYNRKSHCATSSLPSPAPAACWPCSPKNESSGYGSRISMVPARRRATCVGSPATIRR